MKYTRVYSDGNGESHFEDVHVELRLTDFAPPAPAVYLSTFTPAAQFGFLAAPPGLFGDWHVAPKRQFLLYLSGEIEAQTSDGEVRRFGQGSITLVEDTTGKGHRSRVVSSVEVVLAVVQLEASSATSLPCDSMVVIPQKRRRRTEREVGELEP